MPVIEDGFYDDTLFQLVDDLEKMESARSSAKQFEFDSTIPSKPISTASFKFSTNYTPKLSPVKPKADKNIINIIDDFDLENYSNPASSKRSDFNEEQDSFEVLRSRAYKLRETFRY